MKRENLLLGMLTAGCFALAALVALWSENAQACGKERWPVKIGTDADAAKIDLKAAAWSRVNEMTAIVAPAKADLPASGRVEAVETTAFEMDAWLIGFKLETDGDYHLVLKDPGTTPENAASGRTMIAEIPDPACVGASSPFAPQVIRARQQFEAQFTARAKFKRVHVPVHITGIGFFDFPHGQTGVAQNAIELHPVLSIEFLPKMP